MIIVFAFNCNNLLLSLHSSYCHLLSENFVPNNFSKLEFFYFVSDVLNIHFQLGTT